MLGLCYTIASKFHTDANTQDPGEIGVRTSMSSRKDELLAKKARLAELKRQRELRQEQYASSRQSIGEVSRHLLLRKASMLILQRLPLRARLWKHADPKSTVSSPASSTAPETRSHLRAEEVDRVHCRTLPQARLKMKRNPRRG